MERAVNQWFADAPAQGLLAENAGVAVHGFPNRFDLTVSRPRIGDAGQGVIWQAPFAQVLMLSYQPWHMIAALPGDQTLSTPAGTFAIRSDKMMGSLVVVPGVDLALDRLRVEVQTPSVLTPDGQTFRADEVHLATERDVSADNGHRIGLSVTNLMLPADLAARTGLPPQVAEVHLDATAGFTAPLDRHTSETHPHLSGLSVRDLHVVWGQITATITGEVRADPQGLAEGTLTLKVQNWRLLLEATQAAGLIRDDLARNLQKGLQIMASAGGNPEVLDLPVTLADGQMRMGMFPLGPAPRLAGGE